MSTSSRDRFYTRRYCVECLGAMLLKYFSIHTDMELSALNLKQAFRWLLVTYENWKFLEKYK